jgi:hypothetical protein
MPRIRDRTSFGRRRIEIARNQNLSRGHIEDVPKILCLPRVHYDDQIGRDCDSARDRSGTKPGKIESAFRAHDEREFGDTPVAPHESGRFHNDVGEISLQHCLEIWAPTDIAMTND